MQHSFNHAKKRPAANVVSTTPEAAQSSAQPPRLLDQVRDAIRLRHYSIRTEQAYSDWIKRFILFHHKKHPREMGAPEVEQFLTHLAVDGNVAASTQNQALSAQPKAGPKGVKNENVHAVGLDGCISRPNPLCRRF